MKNSTRKLLSALLLSAASLGFHAEDDSPLSIISKNVVEESISNYKKLTDAGELANNRVVYAPNGASDEEKKKAKEDNSKFQKYEQEIEKANKNIKKDEYPEEMLYYTYTLKAEDLKNGNGFNQIASSLDQLQGTLASINGIASPDSLKPGMKLILPVFQGIYLPENPTTDFEILLSKEYETETNSAKAKEDEAKAAKAQQKKEEKEKKEHIGQTEKKSSPARQSEAKQAASTVKKVEVNGKKFSYHPGKSMSPTASAFFKSQKGGESDKMVLPLSRKILTSKFGYRTSPISGKWKLHAGIDLAAPTGTDILACKSGEVIEAANNNPVYGSYVIIRHDKKTTSTYAHMSKILVKKHQKVKTGETIGKVGQTGMATGPHLHFEIREGGTPKDPAMYVK
ncbi:MAG: M23 family metallopeptidase [Treponema sp.]|nr:M23 family metallopeptidase [Treponema sp.]